VFQSRALLAVVDRRAAALEARDDVLAVRELGAQRLVPLLALAELRGELGALVQQLLGVALRGLQTGPQSFHVRRLLVVALLLALVLEVDLQRAVELRFQFLLEAVQDVI
jgi:hypothetical protein